MFVGVAKVGGDETSFRENPRAIVPAIADGKT